MDLRKANVGHLVWKLDYELDPVPLEIVYVAEPFKQACCSVLGPSGTYLTVENADALYESEVAALTFSASGLHARATLNMQNAQRRFDRLNKLREEAIKENQ